MQGFELINKQNPRMYFRFIDKDEVCVDEQFFVDKTTVNVKNVDVVKHTEIELKNAIERIRTSPIINEERKQEHINKISTEENKKKMRGAIKNRIVARAKIEKGKKEFEIFTNEIMDFLNKKYEETNGC